MTIHSLQRKTAPRKTAPEPLEFLLGDRAFRAALLLSTNLLNAVGGADPPIDIEAPVQMFGGLPQAGDQ